MKKERPILFSTLMVQAILEGRKTQTRRVIKPQPPEDAHEFHFLDNRSAWIKRKINNAWTYFVDPEHGSFPCNDSDKLKCPYGQPGDLLWVRETWAKVSVPNGTTARTIETVFKADNPSGLLSPDKWKPSIHMPKAAARIWLKVKDVRVERLHEISETDSYKEGIKQDGLYIECPVCVHGSHNGVDLICEDGIFYTARSAFQSLWHSINGKESWDTNPWVWVVEFEVMSTSGKPEFCTSKP